MTNKHPYADILQYLIDGGDVFGIQIQYKDRAWVSCGPAARNFLIIGAEDYKFRIKPKTVMFNGVELPMWETTALKYNEKYYVPEVRSNDFVNHTRWFNDELDTKRLNRGLVFLNQEDAIAWGKAMCPKTS